jgi:hypothetical protein
MVRAVACGSVILSHRNIDEQLLCRPHLPNRESINIEKRATKRERLRSSECIYHLLHGCIGRQKKTNVVTEIPSKGIARTLGSPRPSETPVLATNR